MRPTSPLRWLVACCLPAPLLSAPTRLERHSPVFPPAMESLRADWEIAGKVEVDAGKSRLSLHPGQLFQSGFMWSAHPVPSNDFEMTATVEIQSMQDFYGSGGLQDGLAFWYVEEDGMGARAHFESTAKERRKRARRLEKKKQPKPSAVDDLYGYREQYRGLGVFIYLEGSPMLNALAAGPASDGFEQEKVSLSDVLEAPGGLGLYEPIWGEGDLSGKEFKLTVRVEPRRATISVTDCGRMTIDGNFKPGGYIGFTTVSSIRPEFVDFGYAPPGSATVHMSGLQVTSFSEVPPERAVAAAAEPPQPAQAAGAPEDTPGAEPQLPAPEEVPEGVGAEPQPPVSQASAEGADAAAGAPPPGATAMLESLAATTARQSDELAQLRRDLDALLSARLLAAGAAEF